MRSVIVSPLVRRGGDGTIRCGKDGMLSCHHTDTRPVLFGLDVGPIGKRLV